ELAPRDRQMLLGHSEEASEAQDRIRDLAAHLVDHHSLDPSDPLVVDIVHLGSFDSIARNQMVGFTAASFHDLMLLDPGGRPDGRPQQGYHACRASLCALAYPRTGSNRHVDKQG